MLGHIQYIQCTVTCIVRFPQRTNNSVVCTDTHTGTHTHTHTQTLHLMRGKRRERGRRRLKSRTEQQHGFVDVRRLLLRLSDSQCPQALFVVVRKSACLFRIFYVIGQKNLRKKNALLFHSLGTTKILLLKQISVKK